MTLEERELRQRIWASCCDCHGLGTRGLEEHVEAIVRMVNAARMGNEHALEAEARRELQRAQRIWANRRRRERNGRRA